MALTSRALAFASRWFDEATVRHTFEPLIADWQREWHDAKGLSRTLSGIRGATALAISIIAASPNVLLAPSPAGLLVRAMARLTIWTTVMTAVMLAPFLMELGGKLETTVSPYLLVLLLPQAVAVALPFAFTTIADAIRTRSASTREERIAAVRFAIAAFAVMLVLVGWLFPAANQQYRVVMSRAVAGAANHSGPARGLRELSIVELIQDERLSTSRHSSDDRIYDAWIASGARAEPVLRELGVRLSLTVLPMALMWVRWRALRLPPGRWYSPFPLVASAPLLFCSFLALGSNQSALADVFYAPRWTAPLLAVAIMIAASIAIDRLRRRAMARAN